MELVQDPTLVIGRTNGKTIIAGTTITAGMPIYADDEDDDTAKPSQANSLATAKCDGFALNNASEGQPVTYQKTSFIDLGCDLVPGEIYCVSADTPGKIIPAIDYADGDWPVVLGIANNDNMLKIGIVEGETEYNTGS